MTSHDKAQHGHDTGPDGSAGPVAWPYRLSTKLLLLTIVSVLIAEVLIFIPSVANFRLRWLEERLSTAAAASVPLIESGGIELPPQLRDDVLMALGAKAIAVRDEGVSRLLVSADMPPDVDEHVTPSEVGPLAAIAGALDTMLEGGDRMLRVYGRVGDSPMDFELILPDA
ncbi:MAG: sensor histidine kinase, partial [Nitratireductor sp.]